MIQFEYLNMKIASLQIVYVVVQITKENRIYEIWWILRSKLLCPAVENTISH